MISVYDSTLVEFPTIGRILTPISCVVSETAGGSYEAVLVHPIDEQGRWKEIKIQNIIKIPVPKMPIPETTMSIPATQEDRNIHKYYTTNKATTVYKYPSESVVIGDISAGVRCDYGYAIEGDFVKLFTPNYGVGYILQDDLDYSEWTETHGSSSEQRYSVVGAHTLDDQCFRIYKTDVDSSNNTITAYARHIFYDLAYAVTGYNNFEIYPSTVYSVATMLINGRDSETQMPSGYRGGNGRAFVAANIFDSEYKQNVSYNNMVQLILDPDNGLVPSARCKIIRDNYMIFFLHNAESENDRGFVVAYGKNLKAVKYTYDSDDAFTAVMPVCRGAQPFTCPGTNEYPVIYHNPNAVASDAYPFERLLQIDVSDVTNDEVGWAKMKQEALEQFSFGCELNKLTVDIDFVNLGDTEEYKQYRNLQNVYIYDLVKITHAPNGFAEKLQVKAYEWDAVRMQYTKITLGDVFDSEVATLPSYGLKNGSVSISKINKDELATYLQNFGFESGGGGGGSGEGGSTIIVNGAEISDTETAYNKTWSSGKINTLLSGKATVNDSATSTESVWSSSKVSSELNAINTSLNGKAVINDSTTNTASTWSSSKINTALSGKASINDSATNTASTWSAKKIGDEIAASKKDLFGVYNVLDYGFKNTGTVDNAANWTALMEIVSDGDTVYFPKGTYRFRTAIPVAKKLRVIGAGEGTVIRCDTDGFVVTASESSLEMMKILPYNGNKTYTAVKLDEAYYCVIDRLHFQDTSSALYWNICIHLNQAWYATVSNCHINNSRSTMFGTNGNEKGVGIMLDICINVCLYNNFIRFKNYGIIGSTNYITENGNNVYCDGVQIEGGNIVCCNYGVALYAGSNFIFNNLLLDQMYVRAYTMGNSEHTGKLSTVYISDAYISCNDAKPAAIPIEIAYGASRIFVSDCTIRTPKRTSATYKNYPAISINNSNLISFSSCDIGGDYNYKPNMAIAINNSGHVIISDNIITNCTQIYSSNGGHDVYDSTNINA